MQSGPRLLGTRATRGTTRLDTLGVQLSWHSLVPGYQGDHCGRGHKKALARQGRGLLAVPPWLMLPRGASTHGALSCATPSSATGPRPRPRERGRRFASAAQGRAQAACRTGLTPTPGSLTNAATVLVPVFAFSIEVVLLASVRDTLARCQIEGPKRQQVRVDRGAAATDTPRRCHERRHYKGASHAATHVRLARRSDRHRDRGP